MSNEELRTPFASEMKLLAEYKQRKDIHERIRSLAQAGVLAMELHYPVLSNTVANELLEAGFKISSEIKKGNNSELVIIIEWAAHYKP